MSLAPYTAVMLASYGGPDRSEDVLPFMRNATAGKGIPDERLLEVSQHYELFGGKSPINELNAALMARVAAELGRRGIDVPVVIGNRNWTPYVADTFAELAASGVEASFDAYPYTRGCSILGMTLLPPELNALPAEEAVAVLRDPAERARVRAEWFPQVDHYPSLGPEWPDLITIGHTAAAEFDWAHGLTLRQIAQRRGTDPDRKSVV
mgnify:CR=1 FL=1